MIFYFSDYTFFPLIIFILCILVLAILAGPFLVIYFVFRNPDKRPSDYVVFKKYAKWLGLIINATAIFFLLSTKIPGLSINALNISRLVFISWLISTLALIFGIISLPKLQGFVTLITFCVVWFFSFVLLSSH